MNDSSWDLATTVSRVYETKYLIQFIFKGFDWVLSSHKTDVNEDPFYNITFDYFVEIIIHVDSSSYAYMKY